MKKITRNEITACRICAAPAHTLCVTCKTPFCLDHLSLAARCADCELRLAEEAEARKSMAHLAGVLCAVVAGFSAFYFAHPLFACAVTPLAYALPRLIASLMWRRGAPVKTEVFGLQISSDAGDRKPLKSAALSRRPSRMLNDVPRTIMRGHWGAL